MMDTLNEETTAPADGASERRIAVVEDNLVTLRLLTAWLQQGGYEVHPAASGEEALRVIDEVRPAIVITDWNMPGISGLDLCRHIRQQNRQPYTYVLMVTAREDRNDVIQAIDAGADDFVSKPIREEYLLARVGQAQIALQRFRRFTELAEIDPLTGVANRRRFHELCAREIARAARHETPLSCMLLDIDLFKYFNDTYGHATGDLILQTVAGQIGNSTRDVDCVCRYGGDEFCVLLPDTREDQAIAFADRLRKQIASHRVPVGSQLVSVQVTLGVVEWWRDIASPRQLIDAADGALLAAKRLGRNRALGYSSVGKGGGSGPSDKLRETLARFHAVDVMTTPAVTLPHNQSLLDAAELFARLRVSSLPIVDAQGRLTGIISNQEVLAQSCIETQWDQPVWRFMNRSVASYEETTSLDTIWETLGQATSRRIIIVRKNVPVGVITRGTLLRWLGTWGPLAQPSELECIRPNAGRMCRHIQAAATAILCETGRLEGQLDMDRETLLRQTAYAGIRIEEQAALLLSLSQIHPRFRPHPDTSPAATPSPPGNFTPHATPFDGDLQEAVESSMVTCAHGARPL